MFEDNDFKGLRHGDGLAVLKHPYAPPCKGSKLLNMVEKQHRVIADSCLNVVEMGYSSLNNAWCITLQANFGSRTEHKNWATVFAQGRELLVQRKDIDDEKMAAIYAILVKARTIDLPFKAGVDKSEMLNLNDSLNTIDIVLRLVFVHHF
jgi:hypothetical protein